MLSRGLVFIVNIKTKTREKVKIIEHYKKKKILRNHTVDVLHERSGLVEGETRGKEIGLEQEVCQS